MDRKDHVSTYRACHSTADLFVAPCSQGTLLPAVSAFNAANYRYRYTRYFCQSLEYTQQHKASIQSKIYTVAHKTSQYTFCNKLYQNLYFKVS